MAELCVTQVEDPGDALAIKGASRPTQPLPLCPPHLPAPHHDGITSQSLSDSLGSDPPSQHPEVAASMLQFHRAVVGSWTR